MRVRCTAERPTAEQAALLGKDHFDPQRSFGVRVGTEYLVYALEFHSGHVWVELAPDFDQIIAAPLFLFEVSDPAVPPIWRLKVLEDGSVMLWPPSFFREYYHSDLAEGVPEVVDDFRDVRETLLRYET